VKTKIRTSQDLPRNLGFGSERLSVMRKEPRLECVSNQREAYPWQLNWQQAEQHFRNRHHCHNPQNIASPRSVDLGFLIDPHWQIRHGIKFGGLSVAARIKA
jgi:hypothetical protein